MKPLPHPFALADISYDLYQVDKNARSETEMSLGAGADGICGLPELRPTTSVSVNVRCFAAGGHWLQTTWEPTLLGRVLTAPLPPLRLR